MTRYTAAMQHNAKTIGKLVETQQKMFQAGRRAAHLLICVLLILYGLFAGKGSVTSYLALVTGCVMVTGLNAGVRRQTQNLLQQMDGVFPQSQYAFSESGFRFYDEGETIPYGRLTCLVEDQNYLYLYISSQSAYMVDQSTISGGAPAELKAFLSQKTGLSWSRPISLLTVSLPALWRLRKKHDYQGPRLK